MDLLIRSYMGWPRNFLGVLPATPKVVLLKNFSGSTPVLEKIIICRLLFLGDRKIVTYRKFYGICYLIFCQVSSLNTVEQKVSELVGVTEAFLSRKVTGHGSRKVANTDKMFLQISLKHN